MIDQDRFERLVGDALDSLPPELGSLLDNVVVLVEDEHPSEDLYGLYEGIPQSERGGLRRPRPPRPHHPVPPTSLRGLPLPR